MEKYAITIRETISRTIIVEAEDLAEAVLTAKTALTGMWVLQTGRKMEPFQKIVMLSTMTIFIKAPASDTSIETHLTTKCLMR